MAKAATGSKLLRCRPGRKAATFCASPAHDIADAAWLAGDVGYPIGGIRAPYVEPIALPT